MRLTHEWQHVVLADAVEADVADQHDLVVFLDEEFLQVHPRVLVQAGEQLGIHAGDTGRRFLQPFAVGILANGGQYFPHRAFDSRQVDPTHQRMFARFVGQAPGDRLMRFGIVHDLVRAEFRWKNRRADSGEMVE